MGRRPSPIPPTARLSLLRAVDSLAFVTIAAHVLTEQFQQLPAVCVAFVAAHIITSHGDAA